MASEPVLQIHPEEVQEEAERPGRWRRFRGWLSRFWRRMQPGPRARRGAKEEGAS